MNPLEKEVIKYEKGGYKVEQRRTLKYGVRTFLKKRGGIFENDKYVYIYYVNRDVTTDNLRECFKDYMKFYEENNFNKNDIGLFLCTGKTDKKLFRDLRKAVIDHDDIRNSIKLKEVNVSERKEPLKKGLKNVSSSRKIPVLTHDETERIIHRVGTICCYPNCKETIALDVHHIIPREEKGTNRDSNLIVLCPSHHRLADRGAIPRKRLEMYSVMKMEMGKKQA